MIAAWVIALTAALAYGVIAGCSPRLATDLGVLFAVVIVAAWAALSHLERNR